MNTHTTIRVATRADASRIAELHAASWRVAYRGILSDSYLTGGVVADRAAVWSGRLATPKPRQHLVLAEIGDTLAGFACAFGESDLQWGTLLDNLHVDPTLKHQGIGRRLMAEVAMWCSAELPGQGMYLWVLEPNLPARRFYERLGGVNTGRDVWNAPDGQSIPELRYSWEDLDLLLQMIRNQ